VKPVPDIEFKQYDIGRFPLNLYWCLEVERFEMDLTGATIKLNLFDVDTWETYTILCDVGEKPGEIILNIPEKLTYVPKVLNGYFDIEFKDGSHIRIPRKNKFGSGGYLVVKIYETI